MVIVKFLATCILIILLFILVVIVMFLLNMFRLRCPRCKRVWAANEIDKVRISPWDGREVKFFGGKVIFIVNYECRFCGHLWEMQEKRDF